MKRVLTAVLLAALLCGSLAGCGGNKKITFTDDLGREITLRQPEKVAALLGSFAQVWHLAGGRVAAAPDDAFSELKVPRDEMAVNLGETKELSLELLLQIQPDFVIASANSTQHLQWQQQLEEVGISVAYFRVDGFSDYLRMLKICTDITGCTDRYETYGTSQQSAIDAVRHRFPDADGPRVLVLRASHKAIRAKTGDETVLGVMLRELGCRNVAEEPGAFVDPDRVTMDDIAALDPDYIFVVPSGDDEVGMQALLDQTLGDDPRWPNLTAAKNGRAYVVEKELFQFKPNHRWAQAYETLETYFFGS